VVPDRSPFEADLIDIRRLPRRAMKELERFFEATDALEDKQLEFLGWEGASKAIKTIEKYSREPLKKRPACWVKIGQNGLWSCMTETA
jgi:inorganic pyrophosphatase